MAKNQPKPLGLYLRSEPKKLLWTFPSARDVGKTFGISQRAYDKTLKPKLGTHEPYCCIPGADLYILHFIEKSVHDTFPKKPDKHSYVVDCIKKNVRFENVTLKEPMKRCEGKVSCGKLKPAIETYFERFENGTFRATCRECRVEQNRNASQAFNAERADRGWFDCKHCEKRYSVEQGSFGRDICKACYNSNRQMAELQRKEEKGPVHRDALPEGKPCTRTKEDGQVCGAPFDRATWPKKWNRWGSWCRTCYNNAKYWKTYRERRRNEDILSYWRECAEYQAAFRKQNPEKCREYNDKRRMDPMWKIRGYVRRAAMKGIVFRMEELEQLAAMMLEDCHYCGASPTDTRINGLDRLGIDYTLSEVVPACYVCNMMIGNRSEGQFLALMKSWDEARRGRKEEVDLSVPMESRMCGVAQAQVQGRKAGRPENPRHKGTCYLCGHTGIVGIDRVDSTKSYEEPGNTRDCCTTCNLTKKDFSYEAIMAHAARVCKVQAGKNVGLPVLVENKKKRNDSSIAEEERLNTQQNDSLIAEERLTTQRNRWRPQRYGYFLYHNDDIIEAYLGAKEFAERAGISEIGLREILKNNSKVTFGVDFHLRKVERDEFSELRGTANVSEKTEKEALDEFQRAFSSYYTLATRGTYSVKRRRGMALAIFNPDGENLIAVYENMGKLADALNVDLSTVNKHLENGKLRNRWTVKEVPATFTHEIDSIKVSQFIDAYRQMHAEAIANRGIQRHVLVLDEAGRVSGKYRTVKDAADEIGCSRATFHRLIKSGEMFFGRYKYIVRAMTSEEHASSIVDQEARARMLKLIIKK